jgi:hypothetical protein
MAILTALLVATTAAAGTVQHRGDVLLDQASPGGTTARHTTPHHVRH